MKGTRANTVSLLKGKETRSALSLSYNYINTMIVSRRRTFFVHLCFPNDHGWSEVKGKFWQLEHVLLVHLYEIKLIFLKESSGSMGLGLFSSDKPVYLGLCCQSRYL